MKAPNSNGGAALSEDVPWRRQTAFRRRELQRALDKALDRGARSLLNGEDPIRVIARVATILRSAKVNLSLLELLSQRAAEIEAEDLW